MDPNSIENKANVWLADVCTEMVDWLTQLWCRLAGHKWEIRTYMSIIRYQGTRRITELRKYIACSRCEDIQVHWDNPNVQKKLQALK